MRFVAKHDPSRAPAAVDVAPRRNPLNRMRRTARNMTERAQSRARGEIDRRRSAAAVTLETLAGALRPQDGFAAAQARRKALAVAGGSGLALTAALGLGVALGMLISGKLQKRAELKEAETVAIEPPPPVDEALLHEPVV